MEGAPLQLNKQHFGVFKYLLKQIPYFLKSLDSSRVMLVWVDVCADAHLAQAFYALGGLDLMGIDICEAERKGIADWVYTLQIQADSEDKAKFSGCCGFRGGNCCALSLAHDKSKPFATHMLDASHLTMTYTALCTLAIVRDDFSRVDRPAIVSSLCSLKQPDGSFQMTSFKGSEVDCRSTYCAVAIAHMIQDWSAVDVPTTTEFLLSCQSWEGGFGLVPGMEGHGGSTFCAMASLHLMGQLGDRTVWTEKREQMLIRWCVHRQQQGFQGRINKDEDSCYTFWIGATLQMLGRLELLDKGRLRDFVAACQEEEGGFCRDPECEADPIHSFFSLAGLSLLDSVEKEREQPGIAKLSSALRELNPALAMASSTVEAAPFPAPPRSIHS